MYYLDVTSNIMSLSGIAIAIGAMVDASIIMVENAHKKLEEAVSGQAISGQQNRCNHRGCERSRPFPLLFTARHYRWISSCIYTSGSGRKTVQAFGIYKDICDALFIISCDNIDPGIDDHFYQRKDTT